jgi:hypothetical protein
MRHHPGSVLFVLLLLAAPALALDCAPGSGTHFNGAEMICDTPLPAHKVAHPPACPPAPECAPTTAPGSVCTWPTTARVMALKTPTGETARVVALVEGPVLVPLAPFATRFGFTFRVSEQWLACTAQGPEFKTWEQTESYVNDVFCFKP